MPSASRPDWDDMQGLILSAYPRLEHAAYCLLAIQDEKQAQKWLKGCVDSVTNASRHQQAARHVNLNIALTYTGLVKLYKVLETGPEDLSGFSSAFIEGIDGREYRSRILGDVGNSAPGLWEWGGKRWQVDLLVMVYADAADLLRKATADLLSDCGMTFVRNSPIFARSLAEANRREHFGFVDGVSQPILKGTPDAERFPDSIHVTELGEIVLGYPDALGCPDTPDDTRRIPSLAGYTKQLAAVKGKRTQFGTNGTYLVFRQLFQDVPRFRDFIAAQARTPGWPDSPEALQLASKIMGRRPDGTPLVPYVNVDDNEFSFEYDPHGNGCPIGAHVRRANPRDSTSTDLAQHPRNRHRLLRRGRSYGNPADGDKGLLFLALNADFERQFEFIHQNWINDPGFGGLANERDPLVGVRDAADPASRVFTIPTVPAPVCIAGLPPFVQVKGGEYFFLPGIQALKYLAGMPLEAGDGNV